ncbi:MAG: DNA-3-methyladenine glycosylase 2 family protein [Actinobacteria bacterium]|nr:DNA-3-methyladenine glycosylase 2 family protein [Actinomycetota bacterium]
MYEDFERCYRAVQSKDARFDGWFVTAVLTTKIYCRPSCPVRPPFAKNIRFLPTAAAAQAAGFRACKRCRPDASPGSPEWNLRSDSVSRAMRLIADGVVDREGVTGLAARLGYSTRQLERHLIAEVGAGPLALARAQRAQTARLLIETTELAFSEVAFGAGFSSIRQFNDTVRLVFDGSPTTLREQARKRGTTATPGALTFRLPFRKPFTPEGVFGHLVAVGIPGVEEYRDGAYRRSMQLPNGTCVVSLQPTPDHVLCRIVLGQVRDLPTAIARCRRMLDLDADPEAVDDALSADKRMRVLVSKNPGSRIPRTTDEAEMAVRVVIGQQISTAAARTHGARLAHAAGTPIADPEGGGITHLFPSVDQLAGIDPALLKMPGARRRSFMSLVRALGDRTVVLDAGADWWRARERLHALPGIGPWTVEMIALRALGDPDAFPSTDLGVVKAARRLGVEGDVGKYAYDKWRPWRSYAVQYLWSSTEHAVNDFPPKGQP